ncbi:glycosyltransferase family 4 protein [Shinella sp. S4-D37]|uniref:glycosyltransferase family 4 protein n=1 Tax=Shinella sp. S4-D37 TaxID=3161999 RepID=UPI003464FE93
MKLAYFVLPHLGGTYTVFRQLRRGLAPYDVDLRWLGLRHEAGAFDPALAEEAALGTSLDMASFPDEREMVRRLADILLAEGFDGVVVNVLSDRVQTNIVRYLPPEILRFMVVHTITPGTYAAACAIAPHVHATICVCRRARDDLVERHGFPAGRIHVIPNAVSLDDFQREERAARTEGLRLLFLGRIDDSSKGVLWLPEILARAPDTATLTVVGHGPDLPRLQAVLPASPRITFLGAVGPRAVPALMARHDIFLMPSRYEGSPMALVEAMAGGCVPVASALRGVTDMVVDDGFDGLLFPVGDRKKAADLLCALDGDRSRLSRLSAAARAKVAGSFTVARMAMRYAEVLRRTAANPPPTAPALPIEAWSLPQGLRPGLRTYLPRPVKNWLRLVLERLPV